MGCEFLKSKQGKGNEQGEGISGNEADSGDVPLLVQFRKKLKEGGLKVGTQILQSILFD